MGPGDLFWQKRRKFGFSLRRKDAIGFASHWRLLCVTWTEISDRFHPSPLRVTRMVIENNSRFRDSLKDYSAKELENPW